MGERIEEIKDRLKEIHAEACAYEGCVLALDEEKEELESELEKLEEKNESRK